MKRVVSTTRKMMTKYIYTGKIYYASCTVCYKRLHRWNKGRLCFVKINMQYLSTSAFISYCHKIIFRFEWATQGLFYYLKGSTLIQSDRCWRKNREVMKDSSSMGIKAASWDSVSASHACSVGLLCSLSRYTAQAYQAPLSFSLHTQMDLWGIQPKVWVG